MSENHACAKGIYIYLLFIISYLDNKYSEWPFCTSIGIESNIVRLKFCNSIIRLIIWDGGGQDRFRSLYEKYYSKADCCLLVYNIEYRETFEHCLYYFNVKIKE